jgi:hypothetical protein
MIVPKGLQTVNVGLKFFCWEKNFIHPHKSFRLFRNIVVTKAIAKNY